MSQTRIPPGALLMAALITLPVIIGSVPVGAQPLDLERYLERVEANSKDLQVARKDIALAETDIRSAWASVFPRVGASAAYTRNLSPLYIYQMGGRTEITGDDNQFQAGVNLSQRLVDLTALAGIQAAREFRALTDELYGTQEAAILTGAKKAFYMVLLMREIYDVRQASEQNAYENYLDIRTKFETGVVSQLAVLQAEVAWKERVPETTNARKNLDVALLNLRDLAGIAADDTVELAGSLEDYPPLPEEVSVDAALASRPDYKALLSERRLRQIGVDAARAAGTPVVSAGLTYGYSAQSDDFALEQENNLLQLQLEMEVPVFTGGLVRSQIRKAGTEVEKAEIQVEQKRQDIRTELDELGLRLREANERIASAERTVAAAGKALEITETSVANGLATQLELKDAQVSYDQARLVYFSSIFDYLNAYFDWELSTGRATE